MRTFFSSDWHLGHANVIKYDERPFNGVEEMDRVILTNATERLRKGDNFYYLGDFALTRSPNAMEGYMKSLLYTGANLFFIKGNHDKRDTVKLYERYGTYLGEQKKIRVADATMPEGFQEIVLNHFAMRVWEKSHHGVWHLYGHDHDSLDKDGNFWGKSMDVGVPSAYRLLEEYAIFSYEEIRDIMKSRDIKASGHHNKETGRE